MDHAPAFDEKESFGQAAIIQSILVPRKFCTKEEMIMKAIWAEDYRRQKNHTLAFRCSFAPEKGTVLHITAASLYRIMINGELIGYGPARGPHGYARIDSYCADSWGNGFVTLVIEVYAPNVNSFYTVEELPFFAAELIKGENCIASSYDFEAYLLDDRVTRVQRFSFQRTFTESYHLDGRRNALYTGKTVSYPKVRMADVELPRCLKRGVSYPLLEEVDCSLIECGKVSAEKQAAVWEDRSLNNIGPNLKGFSRSELEECLSDEVSRLKFSKNICDFPPKIHRGEYRLYDFKESCTGFCSFELQAEEKSTLYLIFDEVASKGKAATQIDPFRNDCCNVMKFEFSPGTHKVLNFEANTMRFLSLILTAGEIELRSLKMITYENPEAVLPERTGDDQLDAILNASRRTFAQNAVDVLTDCPSRERAGWLCDSYFSARAERLFTGNNRVEHNFLENYILSPQSPFLPRGMLPMCYPADHNDGVYIPNWPMWWVLELEGYLDRTEDSVLVSKAEEKVEDLLSFYRSFENEDGLLENLSGWVFIEWSKCNDPAYIAGVNFPTNMLYAKVLETAGRLYGHPERIRQAEQLRMIIKKQSFNGMFFEENRVRKDGKLIRTGNLSETCQYYAFYFGLASRETEPVLYEILLHQFGPSRDPQKQYPEIGQSNAIVGNYLRLEILLKYEEYETVLEECRQFFYGMAEKTNTLWEHSRASCSLNHGFASVAANYILEAYHGKKA